MIYPREIKIEDESLKKLLSEKIELVNKGIEKSKELEDLEGEMVKIDEKIQELEKTVSIEDLHEKEKAISERVQECIKEMEVIKTEIYERMKKQIPDDLHKQYEEMTENKEKLEKERNKIAIKAQKYSDRIIPIGRRLMKKHLANEFEDYDTIKMENGEIVCSIFSHLEDLKERLSKK